MSNWIEHKLTIKALPPIRSHKAVCSCGWESRIQPTRQYAEQAFHDHVRDEILARAK